MDAVAPSGRHSKAGKLRAVKGFNDALLPWMRKPVVIAPSVIPPEAVVPLTGVAATPTVAASARILPVEARRGTDDPSLVPAAAPAAAAASAVTAAAKSNRKRKKKEKSEKQTDVDGSVDEDRGGDEREESHVLVDGLDARLQCTLQQRLGVQRLFPVQQAVWAQLRPPPSLPPHQPAAHGRKRMSKAPHSSSSSGSGSGSGGVGNNAAGVGCVSIDAVDGVGAEFEADLPHVRARDVCVSAPTGSGKTLAYALPIVQALSDRVVCRVRALVVVPTRDLAEQVASVFNVLASAVGLRVGVIAGRTSLANEAAMLAGDGAAATSMGMDMGTGDAWGPSEMVLSCGGSSSVTAGAADGDGVDIVVATPGRLVEHLSFQLHLGQQQWQQQRYGARTGCGGCLSLQHLKFLVVDEADRLLRQSYNDWLACTLGAIDGCNNDDGSDSFYDSMGNSSLPANGLIDGCARACAHAADARTSGLSVPPCSMCSAMEGLRRMSSMLWGSGGGGGGGGRGGGRGSRRSSQVVKVVLSATLTRDPAKLHRLRLHAPVFVAAAATAVAATAHDGGSGAGKEEGARDGDVVREGVGEADMGEEIGSERYTLPDQLHSFMMVCEDATTKPLVLAALLTDLLAADAASQLHASTTTWLPSVVAGVAPLKVLVLAASVEAAHRLYLLLSATELKLPFAVAEFSSLQSNRQRREVLQRFRTGAVRAVVASDAMARGMDVAGVGVVVSYDAPRFAKTLVHRFGRTARAGQAGVCVTLLKRGEVAPFRHVLRKVSAAQTCKHVDVPKATLQQLLPLYPAALQALQSAVGVESARVA